LKVQKLLLENFRNHKSTLVQCSPGINIFLGNNGEGKTNILEGITYLCLSKSFFVANDSIVLNVEGNGFCVSGNMFSDSGVDYDVRIDYSNELKKKTITVNKAKIDRASTLIGQFPVVILTPEQSVITLGSPADRRRFVDFVIAQSSKVYLENLINYRQVLKQRNKILSNIRTKRKVLEYTIEPWNMSLIRTGSMIIKARMEFVKNFQNIMVNSYARLVSNNEKPDIAYEPSIKTGTHETDLIGIEFSRVLDGCSLEEMRTGFSLAGPHRDDFIFTINGLNARSHASQGQHKTLLVALKLAEFFYLKERCYETPLLLMDDVLSELDKDRAQRLLAETSSLGQIFITSTDERVFTWLPSAASATRKIFIKQGRIERVEDTKTIH
jgi:DNA replication and repair protein RecF